MEDNLILVGAAEIDITPPVGTALAGSLKPRVSTGIEDPLYVKSIVIESGGAKLAYVIFDLIAIEKETLQPGIEFASKKTGIPQQCIVWAASHTHTGPYTTGLSSDQALVNEKWLSDLSEKMAQCIIQADRSKRPARFSHTRNFHYGLGHNRRVKFKNGIAINTWLLANAPLDIQAVGSAGPVDPEIGIICFEDTDGKLLALMYHFTLHTNTNFGPKFSADYPGVVSARIRERFGSQVISCFMPGACADINTNTMRYRETGNALSEKIIEAIEKRKVQDGPLKLAAIKAEITVPLRDFADQTQRIKNSGWDSQSQEVFFKEIEIMKKEGKTEDRTIIQAWRIGDTGFVSLPGELFVELGLKIKQESPFPFTYPVELGGDYLGYLVTQQAWLQGGYESLIARSARISVAGVMAMVDKSLEMLEELKKGDKK